MKIFTDLEVLAIPTKTNFRGINSREIAIFRGSAGWSEFSPFIEYSDEECRSWMKAALEGANKPWGALVRSSININATLPKVKPEKVPEILKNFPGVKVIKIKVDSFEEDADLVDAALEYAPDARIRLDINGGWDLKHALLNLHDFHLRFGKVFDYIEQPVENVEDLKKLKAEVPMKIAVDETIRKHLNSDMSQLKECADIAIIKWQPVGGASEVKALSEKIGLPVVISSALESGIGLSHGLAIASELNVDLACGLGTANLLESDIVQEELTINNGEIEVMARTPDEKLVAKYRATEERRAWWIARMNRVLESGGFDEYIN
jgi:O-succinylbenzoate synthase